MDEQDKQQMLMKASMLQQQSQEIEQNLALINNQITEMDNFEQSLSVLEKTKEKEMLSSLGKGVYVETELKGKDLFVEVGSGVIVKKTPEETRKIIESQIIKLKEAQSQLQAQLEMFHQEFQSMVSELESSKEAK